MSLHPDRTAVNVAGDLVAASVLNKYVGGDVSAVSQSEAETKQEQLREQTGADVLVQET